MKNKVLHKNLRRVVILYPYVWLFVIFFLSVEVYKYPGVFCVNSILPIFLFSLVAMINNLFPRGDTSSFYQIVFKLTTKLSKIIFVFSFFGYFYFSYLESIYYSNFVFSTFHLNFRHLLYINAMSLLYIFFNNFDLSLLSTRLDKIKHTSKLKVKNKLNHRSFIDKITSLKLPRKQLSFLFIIIPVLIIGYENLVKTTPDIIDELLLTVKHINSNYDQKMEARWGDFYNYMLFVKENTSEDAVIYHPPQIKPWELEGNEVLLRYFLYPRTLVSGSIPLADYQGPKITDILIVWGKESPGIKNLDFGWPKEEFNAQKIILMNKVYDGSTIYIPGDQIFNEVRGIIKL